ncbi:MAG: DUF5618 family protein [Candidatus Symbiothrix sp.]|jgi:hypothetical protein|nr:DUF5618 family protein [Candidatus Symbiothrix sp.]
MEKIKHPIFEAERYLQNAHQILSEKAKKEGDYYNDSKYVKLAGHAAWSGVLIALDAVLGIKDKLKKNQRLEFKDYLASTAKKDNKMIRPLLGAYDSLHKAMGYDGNPNYRVVQASLDQAKFIIDWAAQNYSSDIKVESKSKNSFLRSIKFW